MIAPADIAILTASIHGRISVHQCRKFAGNKGIVFNKLGRYLKMEAHCIKIQ